MINIVDLGTEYSYELKEDIQSGTFDKAVVGGRLTLNGHKYLFAHPDYWFGTGDTECTSHHMVVVPEDGFLGSAQMETTNTTENGYALSAMRQNKLALVKDTIKNDFGANNILSHREYFVDTLGDGYDTAGAWYDSEVDLMNEIMVYGTQQIFTNVQNGTNIAIEEERDWMKIQLDRFLYTIDKDQLILFKSRPDLIVCRNISGSRNSWWLRDVVSATHFAYVNFNGYANYINASDSHLVRPAFAIC